MAKKSKLAARVAELEAAVAGLFTGTPAAPAKRKTKAKKARARKTARKTVKAAARKVKKATKRAVRKAKRTR